MKVVRGALSVSFALAALTAVAQPRIVKEPPTLLKLAPKSGTLMAVPESVDAAGEAQLDLNIVFTTGTLWNPATRTEDQVRLRSYQGKEIDPDTPFISPKIEVVPGDTIRITLNNQLDPDPTCTQSGGNPNTPHCFNGTNLHTHGLWVNPAGNGDNVLISINPGVSFQYEYKIPPDHPARTFWYHTHRHGSTALQVSSGMAGAIIIRGDRTPRRKAGKIQHGDLDTLLDPVAGQPFKNRTVVLQQIQYACRDASGAIKRNPDGTYKCDPGDVGGIEKYDDFGPLAWGKSGRYTSINGEVLPTFTEAKAGQIERWRIIHGGIRDTVALQFREMKADAPLEAALAAEASDAFVGANCTGSPLMQHAVAADGLTLGAVMKAPTLVFQPGYRWDSLVVFPKPGTYCVIDDSIPAPASIGDAPPSRRLLGFVKVAGGTSVTGDLTEFVKTRLVAAAKVNMPSTVRATVTEELEDGLKLTSFVPHSDITDGELKGDPQTLTFSISAAGFLVDGKPYDPSRIDRMLTLGNVEEWTLKSDVGSHPFHIHINPFQVVKILDPSGKDVSEPGATDGTDPQYPGLKGVWKDTLWVKKSTAPYTIVVRTRYQRYIGDFVLHCHILDHEDSGMMQNVRIALPGAAHANH